MIEYVFQSNSNSATKKLAEFIKGFSPKIDFTIEEGHFGLAINCKFKNQNEKDSFIHTLIDSINIAEDGSYIT